MFCRKYGYPNRSLHRSLDPSGSHQLLKPLRRALRTAAAELLLQLPDDLLGELSEDQPDTRPEARPMKK